MATAATRKRTTETLRLEPARVQLALDPTTYDEAKGEMEVLWHREGFLFSVWRAKGEFSMERILVRLSFAPEAMRKERLDQGLAVLHEHGFSGLKNTLLGRTASWSQDGSAPARQLKAKVRFTRREDPETAGVLRDIRDGILGGISAGVSMYRLEPTDEAKDGEVVYEATDWEPFEISFVAAPRDALATSLSQSGNAVDCTVVRLSPDNGGGTVTPGGGQSSNVRPNGSARMDPKDGGGSGTEVAPGEAGEVKLTAAELASREAAKVTAERSRVMAVTALAGECGIETATLSDWIAKGTSIEDARKVALSTMVERQKAASLPAGGGIRVGDSPADRTVLGVEAALMRRVNSRYAPKTDEQKKAHELARAYHGFTLLELARAVLSARGMNLEGKGRGEVARLALGAHGVSDFAKILENVQVKYLQDSYEATPSTYEAITKFRDAVDFKQMSTVHIGLGSKMVEQLPGEPVRFGTFTEGGEKFAVKRYATGTAFTPQAIVNDDLNAFEVMGTYGQEIRLLPNRLAWALIVANATMADGLAIFHSTHLNDLAGGADKVLSEDGLSALRKLLRLQKEPDGRALSLMGRTLVVPAALETTARKLVAATDPTATSGVNTFSGTQLIIEPELDALSATNYYLVEGQRVPCFEAAFLDGNRMGTISSERDFETDALKVKAVLEVGITVPNHRGWARSLGTTA